MVEVLSAEAGLATDTPPDVCFAEPLHRNRYFAIGIVNLFLTLIALGIYSAWATVRKKRCLYGDAWVADANFE